MGSRSLSVDFLARVEGEGGMTVCVKDDVVEDVQLRIFEPPRFFEAFLQGRSFMEAPDITARICGICPVAYQMSSAQAMEAACCVEVGASIRELRRLIYSGEWIESHVLHMYLLHAPDFLGYPDSITLARDHPDFVTRGLRIKKLGNEIVALIGGREIHPINVRVGGFYKAPSKAAVSRLEEPLRWALDAAVETVKLVSTFDFPEFDNEYEFVALRHPQEYPICEGRVVSSGGLDIAVDEYENHFDEEHVARSNALHGKAKGETSYCVGPLARYALNHDKLSDLARQCAADAGLCERCTNPFQSIVVRAVETVQALEEALRIVTSYEPPAQPFVPVEPRAGRGCGATEAPRGICYHSYEIDADGIIQKARIMPPTSQSLPCIEDDIAQFVQRNLHLSDDQLQKRCEQAVRNYDPCISCATHSLTLTLDRR